MMGTEQIIAMSNEAAARAAQDRLTPYVPWDAAEVARWGESSAIPIPNLGSYRPEGWELVEHRMADATGWGADDEPAMTTAQLRAWVTDHITEYGPDDRKVVYGYGIIEVGQFQVVVGRFKRV